LDLTVAASTSQTNAHKTWASHTTHT